MNILDRKLRILKEKLKIRNKEIFGYGTSKVAAVEDVIKEIQGAIERSGYNDLLHAEEIKTQQNLEVALNMEEKFGKEKFRLNWHIVGDRNTRFFS